MIERLARTTSEASFREVLESTLRVLTQSNGLANPAAARRRWQARGKVSRSGTPPNTNDHFENTRSLAFFFGIPRM